MCSTVVQGYSSSTGLDGFMISKGVMGVAQMYNGYSRSIWLHGYQSSTGVIQWCWYSTGVQV